MSIFLHHHDIPESFMRERGVLAVDTEAMGLEYGRDRLCLIQLSWGDGNCVLVQIFPGVQPEPVRLRKLLANPSIEKLFHYARFDVGLLYHDLGVLCTPIYCTKIASRLARTFTERHGLKRLCHELLGVQISKEEQSSDWGKAELSEDQKKYAANDVMYLHALRKKLDAMLEREGRMDLAYRCFKALETRVLLDVKGFTEDIFRYNQ